MINFAQNNGLQSVNVHGSGTIENEGESFFGKTIKWLRAPNEIESIKVARKVLAVFLACIISFTIFGIIPVVIGLLEWKKQEQTMGEQQPLNSNLLQDPNIEIPQAIGEANLELERFHTYKFSAVEDELVLAKQDQIVSVNPKYGKLSLAELHENGLLPTNKIVLGDVNIYCSNLFEHSSHNVSIALIEIDKQVFPRLLYHSNSQGTWRVMPYATKEGKKIAHFGKGNCEADTQLPISVICALNKLPHPDAKDNFYKAGNIVQTVAKPWSSNAFLNQIQMNQSMFLDKGNLPAFLAGVPDPKKIHMPKDINLHPDFSMNVADFKQTIPHYGEVNVKIFASKDKSLLYMFYEMDDGRAFLSSVECIREVGINSFGVREKIIEIQNMDAPLLEYPQQIRDGFGPGEVFENQYQSDGTYINNWNYICELEIIRMYYSEQGRDMPKKV